MSCEMLSIALSHHVNRKGISVMAKKGREKKQCWQCKGSGMIRRWYKDKNGKNQSEDTVCDKCGGSGTLEG